MTEQDSVERGSERKVAVEKIAIANCEKCAKYKINCSDKKERQSKNLTWLKKMRVQK